MSLNQFFQSQFMGNGLNQLTGGTANGAFGGVVNGISTQPQAPYWLAQFTPDEAAWLKKFINADRLTRSMMLVAEKEDEAK